MNPPSPPSEEIVPAAGAKDIGIVGMKVYMRGMIDVPKKLLLSYALTQPIVAATIGCDNVEQLKENAEAAANFVPCLGLRWHCCSSRALPTRSL